MNIKTGALECIQKQKERNYIFCEKGKHITHSTTYTHKEQEVTIAQQQQSH